MKRRDVAALVVYSIPTIGLFLQGLLYLTTPQFMPYHGDALGVSWEMLPANYQGFVIGVIKAMGAGSVGVTLAIAVMLLIPFRRGEMWSRWAVPTVGIAFTAMTAYAAYTIDVRTPASPPWRQTCGLAALYLAGACLSYWPSRGRDRRHAVAPCMAMVLASVGVASAQELEPRSAAQYPHRCDVLGPRRQAAFTQIPLQHRSDDATRQRLRHHQRSVATGDVLNATRPVATNRHDAFV